MIHESNKANRNYRKKLLLVGPILCHGGIASVVKSIINEEILNKNYCIRIINTSNYKESSKFGNLLVFIKAIFIFVKTLIFNNVDFVHVHTSYGLSFYRKTFFIAISYVFKKKIILHFHSSKFDDFFIHASGIKREIISFFLCKTNKVVLLCEDWKKKLDENYSMNNTVIIENPVPYKVENLYRRCHSEKEVVKILFIGFLKKSKGIYDLIKIVQSMNQLKPDFRLIVCGKGEEEKEFLDMVKSNNLTNDKIIFMGWTSGQEKMDLYRECDIFILPSYFEGMPMAILEAIAFGMPIISSNIAGIPELVVDGRNGYLLNPGDIDGFVEKITTLILDSKKRFEFGCKSLKISEKFAKDKIAEKWHSLYSGM